ncbi:MAG TPA: DNA internalization-related competence protein ComEC/Rec2 [Burkholderiaceae bacterium]
MITLRILPLFLALFLPLLAWLAGLAMLQECARLPNAGEYGWLVLAVMLLLVVARRWVLLLAPAVLLLAFTQGAWRAQMRLDEAVDPAWEGRDVLLIGTVDSLPSRVQGQGGVAGWRFEFALDEAHSGASSADPILHLPPRMLLSIYAQAGEPPPTLHAGERWQWVVRLKRPHGGVNPFGFDYELWLLDQNLRATGTVRPEGRHLLAPSPWWSVDRLRQRMREALQRAVPDPSSSGVLAGLSLGDQSALGSNDWALMRRTGVAHLLSVSGSHVTMFAWLAQGVIGWCWRRSRVLCMKVPAPRAAMWGGVLAALAYALFSGWGVPAQRTVWMLVTLAVLRQIGVRWPWALCLLVSAFVVTVIDPLAVSQAGFWLSFAAVALLMSSASQQSSAWRGALHAQWVATLGLAPLSLMFFQQISAVGLAANLVAVPLVGFVITPLAMLGVLWAPLWQLGAWLSQMLLLWLRWLDGFGFAVWFVPVAPAWAQVLGLIGGALLVLPLPWRLRACGFALLLPLLWPAPWRPAPGHFDLLAADIGQGTAVLIRTSRHDLLFDTGPQLAPDVDAGQRVLLPLLHGLGVNKLDLLVLSHRDLDHVGGAASVMAGLPVRRMLSSLEAEHRLLHAGVPQERCLTGQHWEWDGVGFEVVHPPPKRYTPEAKSNTLSCLVRVVAANGRAALLTGDIEAAQEAELVASAVNIRSEVLMAPHHGSKTSSSEALLSAVKPQLAVVQAGYRNRFGHPALAILARYQAHDIAVVSSPECGALEWRSDRPGWQCERVENRRYWYSQAERPETMGPRPDDD